MERAHQKMTCKGNTIYLLQYWVSMLRF